MSMKIEDIEGIGPKFGELLRNEGVTSPDKLLTRGATRKGRQELAEKTNIDDGRILKWVNLCDLCRISGISSIRGSCTTTLKGRAMQEETLCSTTTATERLPTWPPNWG